MPTLLSIDRIGPYLGSQPHTHDCWEIGIYLGGRGTAVVGAHRIPFSRGTIVCYPPRIPHRENADSPCLGLFVAASDCSFGADNLRLAPDEAWTDFLRVASLLHEEWQQKRPRWQEACDHLFALLLIKLQRRFGISGTTHPQVSALRREIEEHVANPEFRAGQAVARLPMSPDHLRRLFARELGRSPLAYLNELRIARAKRLLRESPLRIKEVAGLVGIPDEYYFSRLFLRQTGQRPTEYRRALI